jgi:Spy/CpxP family protein refolding chaperone
MMPLRLVVRRLRPLVNAALLSVCIALPAAAQDASPVADPVFRSLYEPELIMKHRRAIGLTDEQRDAISRLIRELQGKVVSLQWELQDQTASLSTELNKPRVDLDRALDRMGRVLQTEREIKEAHLALLVRIKNVLRPEQQTSLQQLRESPGDH